ncbi:MAG TPA: glutamine synthetase family protein [Anaerolineae bacterium]|nr:glutamine synthetase family protein [Anaerolineae bacterium]HQK14804.1 glutamine synthetase family protein [Anaerolineae bacterium]
MVTEILARAKEDDIRFVSFQFTDIFGTIKSVTLPVVQLQEALEEGIFFDGSSVQGFARIFESDMVLVPDPATYRVLPWSVPERRRARIICDVYTTDGKPLPSSPRSILKRVLERATAKGYTYNVGPELEFFLFKRNGDSPLVPVPHDVGGYFDFSPRDEAQQVRSEIVIALEALGIHVEMAHHEVAVGQHEIDFRYADALTTADSAITLKYTVRAIAATYGIYASFMPKPIFGINGSGMHTHQSLSDRNGKNLFYDANDPYNLSKLAYHFLAGQIAHARAISAIGAPTVNSYKRLTPGYEAPVYICWAHRNRSAMIRVPAIRPGKEAATRLELRCPDPSSNPYLLFAVMLAAGLDGIERQLEAPEPVNEDIYHLQETDLAERSIATLPGTLAEALDALEQDEVILEALGEALTEPFIRAKRAEWDEYRIRVTPWELERYLETA